VKTVGDRGRYQTQISDADRQVLGRIVAIFGPLVRLEPIGRYLTMTQEDVWLDIVGQVCVMGSARHWERLNSNLSRIAEFKQAVSLQSLDRQQDPLSHLAETLRSFSATRFYNKSAERLVEVLKSPDAFRDGKLELLEGLSHKDNPGQTRDALMERCTIFRLKSASDFMISVGLSHDVIALDTRIVGMLQDHLGYNFTAAQMQSSPELYLSLESALREFCYEQDVSLAQLDRLLFRFSQMSAIDLVAKHPELLRSFEWRAVHDTGE
jgi:thermostable 8-oxoguanine DNA glycosylase